jgi:N-acetylmuramic acid 6-phosphate (MurNAc-6-P) etherase
VEDYFTLVLELTIRNRGRVRMSLLWCSFDLVNGIIAGDIAIRKAVENAEDNASQAWKDLQHKISANDVVVGIAASGTTRTYWRIRSVQQNNIITGSISCNGQPTLSNCTVSYRRSSGSRVCNRQPE